MSPTPQGGITQSMFQPFMVCRERFRLKVVEGFTEDVDFNHFLEFGSIFHEGLEAYSEHGLRKATIRKYMVHYANKLKSRFVTNKDHQNIDRWTNYSYETFILFLKQWNKEDKQKNFLFQEEAFRVPYQLPSGRTVYLRGKMDGAYADTKGFIWLKENKTKGKIDTEGITQMLQSDLQTMMYLIALQTIVDAVIAHVVDGEPYPDNLLPNMSNLSQKQVDTILKSGGKIKGFLYDVIRRPLGDSSAIKQRVKETDKQFTDRIFYSHAPTRGGKSIYPVAKNLKEWFRRWNVRVSAKDINRFRKECFDPQLEQLCNWWQSIEANPFDPWYLYADVDSGGVNPDGTFISMGLQPIGPNSLHYRRPFGVYDSLSDGMRGAFFDYIIHDGKSRIHKVTNLYPELD